MSSTVTSVEDLCNNALAKIGWRERIGDMYEGSVASNLALDLYVQTRDAMLRDSDWGFPSRQLTLTLLKSAPAGGYIPGESPWRPALNPPLPYGFEYAYPGDCLMLRAINRTPVFVPVFNPTPCVFEIANDNVPLSGQPAAPGRVILCQIPDAIATYCGQVTDMTQWDVGFVEALTDGLARRMSAALASSAPAQIEDEKLGAGIEAATAAEALGRQG